jgi:hypothetical protein
MLHTYAPARCLSPASPQCQQQDHRPGQRHQPGTITRRVFTPLFLLDTVLFCNNLPIRSAAQGLASLTSTIAPAAGGSIYAYFSSLNKVPTLLPRKPQPVLLRFLPAFACTRRSHARAIFFFLLQGWPLNYSFAFIVMSATLALHLGMVWKVGRDVCRSCLCFALPGHHSIPSQIDPNLDKRQT